MLNLGFHCRVKYGDIVVTKKTTMPYKIIGFFLLFAVIESMFLIYVNNVVYRDDFKKLTHDFLYGDWLMLTIVALEICKLNFLC